MTKIIGPRAFMERQQARKEAVAAYDTAPVLCPVCHKPVPYGRFIRGMQTCCGICKNELATKTRIEQHQRNRQA